MIRAVWKAIRLRFAMRRIMGQLEFDCLCDSDRRALRFDCSKPRRAAPKDARGRFARKVA